MEEAVTFQRTARLTSCMRIEDDCLNDIWRNRNKATPGNAAFIDNIPNVPKEK
jgi:hypothetical protein